MINVLPTVTDWRGRANGGPVNDWLAAEREVPWSPPAELTETGDEFHDSFASS